MGTVHLYLGPHVRFWVNIFLQKTNARQPAWLVQRAVYNLIT